MAMKCAWCGCAIKYVTIGWAHSPARTTPCACISSHRECSTLTAVQFLAWGMTF